MIYIIFLCSIVIHECGHLLMAKILKISIKNIKFRIIGISAEMQYEGEINCLKKILVILMGPFTNLIITMIFLYFDIDFKFREQIVYTNLLLFSFNFLPIIPLDGGKILFYVLNLKFNFEKSSYIMIFISKLVLSFMSITYCLVIFIVKNIEIFFVIVYLWYVFIKEERNLELYIKIDKNMKKYLNSKKKCAKIPE